MVRQIFLLLLTCSMIRQQVKEKSPLTYIFKVVNNETDFKKSVSGNAYFGEANIKPFLMLSIRIKQIVFELRGS